MNVRFIAGILGSICILCASCKQDVSGPVPASAPIPEPAPAVSQDDLMKLRFELFALKQRVATLESGEATVSTDEEGYDVARTKFGPLTVSTRGATPYLDGYKVKLRIGNLTNANFNGAKVKLGWGPPFDAKNYQEWSKAQKSKEVDITTKLASGAFTDVEVSLTPAKPEEVKSFTVGFTLNQLELRAR